VRHPGLEDHPGHAVAARQMRRYGALVGFSLPSADQAQAFLGALELVAEATSFGGTHSTAERRARWGTDAVPDGFIRFSAGCEDTADLVADVERALSVSF
jgi:cystathionine gamma-lyase